MNRVRKSTRLYKDIDNWYAVHGLYGRNEWHIYNSKDELQSKMYGDMTVSFFPDKTKNIPAEHSDRDFTSIKSAVQWTYLKVTQYQDNGT